ncbi:hypothetical protein ACOME3_006901 [Neoechinorhynchus agilis]
MAFMVPTPSFRDHQSILELLEKSNAICDCQTSRDLTIYAVSCHSSQMEPMIHLLSECVLYPDFTDENLDEAKRYAIGEVEDAHTCLEFGPVVIQAIHKAAFGLKTLGIPTLPDPDSILAVEKDDIHRYVQNVHRNPNRLLVCGITPRSTNDFLMSVQKNFQFGSSNSQVDHAHAKWTGGDILIEKDMSKMSLGPNPFPDLLHFGIGLRDWI